MSEELVRVDRFQRQHNIPDEVMESLLTVGSLELGRVVYSELLNGVRHLSPSDMALVMAGGKREGGKFIDYTAKAKVEDNEGVTWRVGDWVMDKLRPLRKYLGKELSRSNLYRWHQDGCPYLLGRRVFEARKTYAYFGPGWRVVWVFHEGDTGEIEANIRAKKVPDPSKGEGWDYEECQAQGFGRDWLNRVSRPAAEGGKGIIELGGEVLNRWEENRITEHGHMIAHRVFSADQLRRVKKTRRRPATSQNLEQRRKAAVSFLKDALTNGPAPASQIKAQAEKEGVSQLCLIYARKALKVERSIRDGRWYWFPAHDKDDRLEEAKRFLKDLLAVGPVRSKEVMARAREAKIGEGFLRAAQAALGVSRWRQFFGDPWHWCLPGSDYPPDANGAGGRSRPESPQSCEQPQPGKVNGARRRRGRPRGSVDLEARRRDEEMLRAWQTGHYHSGSDLARFFGVDPSYARKLIRGAGK